MDHTTYTRKGDQTQSGWSKGPPWVGGWRLTTDSSRWLETWEYLMSNNMMYPYNCGEVMERMDRGDLEGWRVTCHRLTLYVK